MKNYKILIVDDSVANLATMISIIEKYIPECVIYQANGAVAALEILENTVPDIILLDWEMPKVNGIELMKKIHALPATENVPCIVVTGVRITAQNLKTALEAGAIDIVRKPIDVIEFLARINSAIVIAEAHKKLLIEKESKIVENIILTSEINHFLKGLAIKANNIEKSAKPCSSVVCKHNVNSLNIDISDKLKSNGWKKYSQPYQSLYPIFTKNLLLAHSDLSKTEVELCQMLRLGLKNPEIAELMFITLGSLNVNKTRLRKKLNLDAYQNIHSYLISL